MTDGGRRHWPLTDYLVEGPRTLDWIMDDVVKHHRTFTSHVGAVLRAGMTIDRVHEWCPSDARPTPISRNTPTGPISCTGRRSSS